MGRKIWQGALAGIAAAILAFCATLPFLPHKALTDPGAKIEPAIRLAAGHFYGWIGDFVFGAAAAFAIALVYSMGRTPGERRKGVLIPAAVGGFLVWGAGALSDSIGLQVARSASKMVGTFVETPAQIWWSLLVSTALCASVLLGMTFRREIVLRYVVAAIVGGVFAFVLRLIFDAAVTGLTAPLLASSAWGKNAWALAAPGLLSANLAAGAAAGMAVAVSERLTRPAWLHQVLEYGEGPSWSVDYETMRIGHAEGVEVRMPERQGLAPIHAQIQRIEGDFAVQDLGGGVRHNGQPVGSAWLIDNDRLTMGPYEFLFHLKRSVRRRDWDLAPMIVAPPKAATKGQSDEPVGLRFEDDFDNVYPLKQKITIVGRDDTCEIRITWEGTISRKHAEIIVGPNGAMIRDLGSSNGTKLNGTVIQSTKVPLKEGDIVEFGKARLTFRE